MNPNQRYPNETEKEYKERLREMHSREKRAQSGRTLWDSSKRGTYRVKDHGALS